MAITTPGSENVGNKDVIFSDLVHKLFKEASKISTIPGVSIALFVFSPDGQSVYTFGHPSVDQVVNDYLLSCLRAKANHREEAPPPPPLDDDLEDELFRLKELVKKEKEKRDRLLQAIPNKGPWDIRNKHDLNLEQLQTLKPKLQELHAVVTAKLAATSTGGAASSESGHKLDVAPADATPNEDT